MEVFMRLFDTHCHIASECFDEDIENVIQRFLDVGGARALVVADPCETPANQEKVFNLIDRYDFLYGAIGVHPHNASGWNAEIEGIVDRYLKHPKCRLLGEIGLDYHYDLSPRDVQQRVFDHQLDMAFDRKIPVQLHIREAHSDCMDLLRARVAAGRMPEGVMHCFTGSWECAKVYLDMGLYISLSGAVTFKNAPKLTEVAQNVPADRLLVETDCPYMTPVPLRGQRNEPAYVAYTVAKIAEIRSVAPDKMAEQLYQNALNALHVQA